MSSSLVLALLYLLFFSLISLVVDGRSARLHASHIERPGGPHEQNPLRILFPALESTSRVQHRRDETTTSGFSTTSSQEFHDAVVHRASSGRGLLSSGRARTVLRRRRARILHESPADESKNVNESRLTAENIKDFAISNSSESVIGDKAVGPPNGTLTPVNSSNSVDTPARPVPDDAQSTSNTDANEGSNTKLENDPKLRVLTMQMELKSKLETINRLKQKRKYLQKSIALKKNEALSRKGEVQLDEDELKISSRMLNTSVEEISTAANRYNELLQKSSEMQGNKSKLVEKLATLISSKREFEVKLQDLTLEDIVGKHTSSLPESMAGAIRKSADALTPFFDTLLVAAETNQRLVDHVGAEIDKFTHVNIRKSPFLSGILFYAILMIPTLTIASFIRRIVDTSSKLTISHVVILGNGYFLAVCILCIAESFARGRDPAAYFFKRNERLCIAFNLFLALYFVWHMGMLALHASYTKQKRDVAQVVATLCIGVHYYLVAWQRIFTNTSPALISTNYIMYATVFGFIIYDRWQRIDKVFLTDFGYAISKVRSSVESWWLGVRTQTWISARSFQSTAAAAAGSRKYVKRGLYQREISAERPGVHLQDGECSDLSEEDDVGFRDSRHQRSERTRRKKSHQTRPAKPGLASFFFGNRDDPSTSDESSESSDLERNHNRTPRSGEGGGTSFLSNWLGGFNGKVLPLLWSRPNHRSSRQADLPNREFRRGRLGRSTSGIAVVSKKR